MPRIFWKHLISKAWISFSSSAVSVHDSHACRQMEITWACISLSFNLRVMFLSLPIGFSLASAVVVWAILTIISSLDPSAWRYLNWDTGSAGSGWLFVLKYFVLSYQHWQFLCGSPMLPSLFSPRWCWKASEIGGIPDWPLQHFKTIGQQYSILKKKTYFEGFLTSDYIQYITSNYGWYLTTT